MVQKRRKNVNFGTSPSARLAQTVWVTRAIVMHGSSFNYLHPARRVKFSTRTQPFSAIISKSNPQPLIEVPWPNPWTRENTQAHRAVFLQKCLSIAVFLQLFTCFLRDDVTCQNIPCGYQMQTLHDGGNKQQSPQRRYSHSLYLYNL